MEKTSLINLKDIKPETELEIKAIIEKSFEPINARDTKFLDITNSISKTHQTGESVLDGDQQSYLDILFETKYGPISLFFNLTDGKKISEKILEAFDKSTSEEVSKIPDDIKSEIFSRLAQC